MKRLIKKHYYRIVIPILVVFVLICLFNNQPIPARADTTPDIDYAPSTIQNGQSVTINGSGFGVKNPVEPLRYDDFQDGTLGQRLKDEASGGWTTQSHTSVFASYNNDVQRIAGDIVAMQHYTAAHYNQNIALTSTSLPQPIHKGYASFWIKRSDISGNAKLSTNMKIHGKWTNDPSSCDREQPTSRVDFYGQIRVGHMYSEDRDYTPSCDIAINMGAWWDREFTQWVRIERYLDTGTVGGNNTITYFMEDGVTLAAGGPGCGSILGDGSACHWPVSFYYGDYWAASSPDQESKTYISEAYYDTTQARIELGNSATFTTCTHREIQIPHTTWVDNQIRFTVNQGSFNNGDPAYLYVVDENGVVNATGYPITFASATGCTPAWECTNWSVCTDSIQTRSCDDHNHCGSDDGRPVETANCDSTAPGVVTDLTAG